MERRSAHVVVGLRRPAGGCRLYAVHFRERRRVSRRRLFRPRRRGLVARHLRRLRPPQSKENVWSSSPSAPGRERRRRRADQSRGDWKALSQRHLPWFSNSRTAPVSTSAQSPTRQWGKRCVLGGIFRRG